MSIMKVATSIPKWAVSKTITSDSLIDTWHKSKNRDLSDDMFFNLLCSLSLNLIYCNCM